MLYGFTNDNFGATVRLRVGTYTTPRGTVKGWIAEAYGLNWDFSQYRSPTTLPPTIQTLGRKASVEFPNDPSKDTFANPLQIAFNVKGFWTSSRLPSTSSNKPSAIQLAHAACSYNIPAGTAIPPFGNPLNLRVENGQLVWDKTRIWTGNYDYAVNNVNAGGQLVNYSQQGVFGSVWLDTTYFVWPPDSEAQSLPDGTIYNGTIGIKSGGNQPYQPFSISFFSFDEIGTNPPVFYMPYIDLNKG
jgi:hypothetical protein